MYTSLRTIGLSLALALPLAAGVGANNTAQASHDDCVTTFEFNQVRHGWTKQRVHRVFDVLGRQTAYYSSGTTSYQDRDYRACVRPAYSTVSVYYVWHRSDHTWRVYGKYADWN